MYSFIYCLFFNCFRYSLAYIKFDSISLPKVITESLSSSFSLDSDIYLSIEKDPNTGVRTSTRSLYGLDGKVRKTIVKEGKPFRMKKNVFKGPEAQKMFNLKFGV